MVALPILWYLPVAMGTAATVAYRMSVFAEREDAERSQYHLSVIMDSDKYQDFVNEFSPQDKLFSNWRYFSWKKYDKQLQTKQRYLFKNLKPNQESS
jgi:hypothetical protein